MREKKGSNYKKAYKEQGYILVIGTLVSAVLLIFSLPFIFQLSSEYRLTEKSYKSLSVLSLAEAGVERAIWELNHGDITTWEGDSNVRTMTISSIQAAGGDVVGDIEIRVEDLSEDNPVVESTGSVQFTGSLTIDRTTRVVLEGSGSPSLFNYGVFGEEEIVLRSNAIIDSYDSRDGLYGGENTKSNGHTGTNSTSVGGIYLYSNAEIHGDALSGPESDPEEVIVMRSNTLISGNKQALSDLEELPSVSSPEDLLFRGSYTLSGQDTISQSGEYTSFVLNSNSKVTINADVILYITGDFTMSSNSTLEIAEGVSVSIYFGGSFEQSSNTEINNLSKDPTKFLMYGTDSLNGDVVWNSNTAFWGGIYVPRANVNYNSNFDLCGSVIAKSVNLRSNAEIHYDEALGELDTGIGGPSTYTVKSWQEKLSP